MSKAVPAQDCCVLNGGNGSWAFDVLARQLSAALKVDVAQSPRRFNYVLHQESHEGLEGMGSFVPLESVRLASDKRKLAAVFAREGVPTPKTSLFDTFDEAVGFVLAHPESEWCLKYPTGCGASGHRMIVSDSPEPANWPKPFIVQEFVKMDKPEVYRLFCANRELFGWVVRRFPEDTTPSRWVAHARGARYVVLDEPPREAQDVARRACVAAGLWESFGCVDLLRKNDGSWVALEVGTDGLFNHVDRELENAPLEAELMRRISQAFWSAADRYFAIEAENREAVKK